MYQYTCELIRVIDGDTVDAWIDLGFDIKIKKRIRLYGINAPETRTRDSKEKKAGLLAKDRIIELIKQNENKFMLKSHGVGKFGRCLGELYIDDHTRSVNDLLILEALADRYES